MSDLDDLRAFAASDSTPTPAVTEASAQPPAAAPQSDLDLLHQFVAPEIERAKFETPGQIALTGVEGAARAATLGGSDIIEPRIFPTSKEAIQTRMQTNPGTSIAGSLVGGAGLIAATGGLGGVAEGAIYAPEAIEAIEAAGQTARAAGASASQVGKAMTAAEIANTTLGQRLGAGALAGAGEGAVFGAGNVVSDEALGDPNLNAQKIIADIGTGALFGIGGGVLGAGLKSAIGKFGGVRGSVSEAIEGEAAKAAQKAETVQALSDSAQLKQNTPEVRRAAADIGAPVHSGMVSDNPYVQRATSSLMHGDPTIAGQAVEGVYRKGYQTAVNAIQDQLGTTDVSQNQLGQVLQDSLKNKIDAGNAPFNELYGAIKEITPTIPLKEGSAPAISRNIEEFVNNPENGIGKTDPARVLGNEIAQDISELKTVSDLRGYQSGLSGRISSVAQSPNQKRILAIISDKLDAWEQRAIRQHTSDFIDDIESRTDMTPEEKQAIWGDKIENLKNLQANIDAADKQYGAFRSKINELSGWLGKGKVSGAKDAIDFISNRLEPEDLIKKLTDTKYAGLYKFMQKEFPQESAVIRAYQKRQIFDFATENGSKLLDPNKVFKKVNSLEPEIQKAIFAPEELSKIKSAETYLRSFPKNFNPSGTSHESALRMFFQSPVQAVTANARDAAMWAFIEHMGNMPESLRPPPEVLGAELGASSRQQGAAQIIMDRTDTAISNGIKSLVSSASSPAASEASKYLVGSYDDKVDRIKELTQDQEALSHHISNHIQGIAQSMPNISQGISSSIAASVGYLNSKIPKSNNEFPFGARWAPTNQQKQKFDRYYNAVANPVSALGKIKDGTLNSETMEALNVTHPDLLKEMRMRLRNEITPNSANNLSHQQRMALSMFLGQPLESSQLPQVIQANQALLEKSASESTSPNTGPGKARSKPHQAQSMKVANRIATRSQKLEIGNDDTT